MDSEYPMDSVPVGKLPDDFDLMGLKFSDGGFMNALEDISEPGYMETSVPSSNMPGMNSMFQQGKPCELCALWITYSLGVVKS